MVLNMLLDEEDMQEGTSKAGVHALVFAGVMYVLHQMYGTEHIGRRGYAGRR